MRQDDSWHGSEDYPGPTVSYEDFDVWATEMGWPPPKRHRHERERVPLTKFLVWVLLASGTGVLWGVIAFIIVAIKETLYG